MGTFHVRRIQYGSNVISYVHFLRESVLWQSKLAQDLLQSQFCFAPMWLLIQSGVKANKLLTTPDTEH